MKTIYIMLTRTGSMVSKIVSFFTKTKYTHASLAFDEDLVELYSSGRKKGMKMFPAGPTKESLYRGFFGVKPFVPCAIYELPVSEEVYEKAKQEIKFFIEHIDEYKFSALGIIACKLNIAWERKNKYFCSQFVAEILTRSGAVEFGKPNCLIHPRDYQKLKCLNKIYEGTIADIRRKIEEKVKKEAVTL